MSLRIVYTSAAAEKPRLTQDLAQWMDIHVAFTWRTRARLYRMIAIRLRQKSELERIMLLYIRQQERRKKTSVPRILNKVLHRMAAQGMSFAEALRPFIPHDEYMMILSGEKGDDIASAMDLLCDIKTRVGRIMRAARSAIGQPLMYVGIIFAFLYTIAKMVIPSLLMNGGMKMKASTSQDMLVFASSLATGLNGVLILSGLVGALILLWLSLTKLTGPLRVFLERTAPWSIYRNIQGYIWISSFIALVRAGMTDTEALTHQMQVATPGFVNASKPFLTVWVQGACPCPKPWKIPGSPSRPPKSLTTSRQAGAAQELMTVFCSQVAPGLMRSSSRRWSRRQQRKASRMQ